MDSYENHSSPWSGESNSMPELVAGGEQHRECVYKKVSPFEDSPYVMQHEPAKEYAAYAPTPKKPRRSSAKLWKRVLTAVLMIVLIAGCCGVTALAMDHYWQQQFNLFKEAMNQKVAVLQEQINSGANSGSINPGTPGAAGEGMTPAQVYAQNVKAVVAISTDSSMGSGFIISEDGYVVSNYHVIDGYSEAQIITFDGTAYDAKVVGGDSSNDISVLKVEASGLPCVTIGSSNSLAVGDQVVAIGNPLGELTSTLTVGYVSGKDRIVTTEGMAMNMLQTDAAINSGNSGGPLFNMNGEVVGITTAKYSGQSSTGASIEGISFAIPIDDVIGMIEDLQQYGYITGVYLGVNVRDVDQMVQAFGLPAGAHVVSVEKGDCADRAGVLADDIIINIGGYEVDSVSGLSRVLRNFEPGETTIITVYRAGAQVQLSITLDAKPNNQE